MPHETLTAEQITRLVKGEDISADFVVDPAVSNPAEKMEETQPLEEPVQEEEKSEDPSSKLTTEDTPKDASFKDSNDQK